MKNTPVILKIIRALILLTMCLILWLLLSNELHLLAVLGGLVFSFLAVMYSYNIFFEKEVYHRSDFIIRFELFLLYAFLFVLQSYAASFDLIYRMITRKYKPGIVRIRIRLRSQVGRVFLSNTITMIPGTLSLWLDGSNLYVHWFDVKSDHSIKAGSMIKQDFEKLLEKIFG